MTPQDESRPVRPRRRPVRPGVEPAALSSAQRPVVDSALRRGALATVELLGAVSLVVPLLAMLLKVLLLELGVGPTPTLEIGWTIALGAATLALIGSGMIYLASPGPLPIGDLHSSDDRWAS